MADWFEKWFDSPHYHNLYAHRDVGEAASFVKGLFDYFHWKEPMEVLDLACGSGRYEEVLTKMGHSVTGLDLSEESIVLARKRDLLSAEFLVGDMRSFSIPKSFDVVLNLFTSFGYFEETSDNLEVMNRVFSHLNGGGSFVIDFLNPQYVMDHLVEEEEKCVGDKMFKITRSIIGDHIVKIIEVEGEQEVHTERVQLITLDQFKSMFEKSGFSLIATFGSYDLCPLREGSDRQIMVARK